MAIHLQHCYRENENIWIYPCKQGARAYLTIDGATVMSQFVLAEKLDEYIQERATEGWKVVGKVVAIQ
jgi:hypothetical protein